jgi:hypothetical protein
MLRFLLVYAFLAAIVLFLLYIPELFPKCHLCKKKKPRFLFKVHRAVSLNIGYGGNRSICKKCCRQYALSDIADLERLQKIKKRIKKQSLISDPLDSTFIESFSDSFNDPARRS